MASPQPLTVCFIWHMHQPSYKDRLSGQYMMPWVRLHAVKDYLDMVTILEEFPTIRQTFNMVPSLLGQLQDYSQPGILDRHQAVTVQEAPFSRDDKRFILERFFDAHPLMIQRIGPYDQNYQTRQRFQSLDEGLTLFSQQDFADITAQFNLCWFDPQWLAAYPELQQMVDQGKNYTLAQRNRILNIQQELVARVIPTYKAFQEKGQIEITTTPYYHPILPLLIDTQSAKVGRPSIHLPRERFQHEEDARVHLERAVSQYQELFGCAPRGIWPSEQSISPQAVKLMEEYGFQWAVSSEGNLARSLGIYWDKDDYGHTRNVQDMARPYAYHNVKLLFRNLTLSDLIGFTYGAIPPQEAAEDCYQRLKKIQAQMEEHPHVQHPIVTLALDGENCWENYPQDGVPFLKALYTLLSEDETLNISRVEDYFKDHCPAHQVQKLTYLHSGSWIESDFHIWIGDPLKNAAWALLCQTRNDLQAWQEKNPEATDILREAWEEIYIAEGSDWFWWYGDPHNSGQDDLFDYQFRLHLKNVYQLLGQSIPHDLDIALSPINGKHVSEPSQAITPVIDGIVSSPEEWDGAGRFDLSVGEGAMHRGDRLLTCIYYGFDQDYLYLRCNIQQDLLKPNHRLAFYFCTPGKTRHNSPVRLKGRPSLMVPTQKYLYAYEVQIKHLHGHHQKVSMAEATTDYLWLDKPEVSLCMAMQDTLEMAIPFDSLEIGPGEAVSFAVAIADDDVVLDFIPPRALLPLHRPAPKPVDTGTVSPKAASKPCLSGGHS